MRSETLAESREHSALSDPSIQAQDRSAVAGISRTPHTGVERLDRLAATLRAARHSNCIKASGRICSIEASQVFATGLSTIAQLGDHVEIGSDNAITLGEIVSIQPQRVTIKLFGDELRCKIGARVVVSGQHLIHPDQSWKGRIIDAFAKPIDDLGALQNGSRAQPVKATSPPPLTRNRVGKMVTTGILAIDLFTPVCAGQRMGLFAGSGVGKSTLMSMFSKTEGFDTIVVALVGERGREVREFIEDALGDNLQRTVVVVATSDESALRRRLAPRTAMTVAEYFSSAKQSVLLIVDSITRYAHACRDVALSAGELPVSRGYPPSTFAEIAQLLERAGPGTGDEGSITGIFSVLVDGDNTEEPVSDTLRGILDGHVVLDRKVAQEGRYPAIDLLTSISRLADTLWSAEERKLIIKLRSMIERYEDSRDIRSIGGYKQGTDPELDECVELVPKLYSGLIQHPGSPRIEDAFAHLSALLVDGQQLEQIPKP